MLRVPIGTDDSLTGISEKANHMTSTESTTNMQISNIIQVKVVVILLSNIKNMKHEHHPHLVISPLFHLRVPTRGVVQWCMTANNATFYNIYIHTSLEGVKDG
jgi:hypothetical protein